ncbi:SHOCT domain-containing protein [Aeromicrobium sp. Marseille-Q0843]|uniref:SHOCT domain-containing protein n=1 Tax=Aeromicrobium phoceense TaxID=2754045 RepID=A0A838X6C2_9ACTN|nr:SHOCT domain-containing protein [Aeromicrobium phoceense]MBA4607069.1 SHOCT domain-containing protein [Aeromicrobium phoceense]
MDSFWDFLWLTISVFFFMAYLMVLFNVIADLFSDREASGWTKAIWVFFLIFVPALTALVYLIARGGGMADRQRAKMTALREQNDAYIRDVAGAAPADQIASAKSLLDSGAISAAEYEQLKAKALA